MSAITLNQLLQDALAASNSAPVAWSLNHEATRELAPYELLLVGGGEIIGTNL